MLTFIGFVVGFGGGAAWYRWSLKRNPAKLELLAQEMKKLGEKLKS